MNFFMKFLSNGATEAKKVSIYYKITALSLFSAN